MYLGEKKTARFKSFHHIIKEGFGHYIDVNQFLGIDPFDRTKFKGQKGKPNTVELVKK